MLPIHDYPSLRRYSFTYQETLEAQRRRPFHLARGFPCATLLIFRHSRGTKCMGVTLLFGQFATNSGL